MGSQGTSASPTPTFFGPAIVQPKLEIGSPDDEYEREADAMAERALRHVSQPELSAPSRIQRKCADCEKEENLQRKEANGTEPVAGASLSDQVSHAGGSGFQLKSGLRTSMESAFQYDFSAVRLHTDSQAVQLSQSINAQAFTYGNDIYFNSGKYNPASSDGQRLLAHELTHVVQQGSKLRRKRIQRLPGSPAGGCGLCYGTPKAVGIEAHRLIQQAFQTRYPYLVREHLLPVLLPGPNDEENGRLDLAELERTDKINIAEIKPASANGPAQGASDILWYKKQLEALGMEVGFLNLPPPIQAIPFPTLAPPPCPATQSLFVDPAVAGVYTYWCIPDYKELVKICKCTTAPDPPPVYVPVPVPKDVKVPDSKRVPDEPIKVPPLVPVGVGAALLTAAAYIGGKALIKRFPPVAIASAAASLLVLLAYPDRVYASPGPGEDPLETLFKAAEANGTPVPKELQDVIKNDPELKKIIEDAAKSGDMTAAQEALNKKVLDTINKNLDKFSEEDLRILMSMTGSGSDTPTNAPTVEQLKAAIEKKRSGAATTPGDKDTGSAPITGTAPSTTPAPPGQEKFPKVSATVQEQFNTTSAPARELFKAMIGTSGNGPKVTDEVILRYLQTVPGDLSVEEAKKLIAQLKPVAGEDLDTIMQRLNQAIQTLRNPKPQPTPGSDGKTGDEGKEGETSDVEEPAGQQAGTKDGDITLSEFTRQMIEYIQKYKGWDSIKVGGTTLVATGDKDFASTPIRGIVHAYAYTKASTSVLAITFLSIRIDSRTGTKPGNVWKGTIVSATVSVANNGRTAQVFSTGKPISAAILSGK
ncbi:hypothetical protein GCM10023187_13750 [Nibrella viscosa]|uniref:eCIS core domain-containing protein n=1 Tax=Nibrella viscosa TaxID=1084524 RepID=A0ABP8K4J2_9BACT